MDIIVPRGKSARIVPVRFVRAAGADEIDGERPEVDNRGHRAPHFGALVGVAEGRSIRVGVARVGVPTDVALHAVVAEGSADIVELVGGSSLGNEAQATITLRGKTQSPQPRHAPADSRVGVLEVRAQSATGPVLGRLRVEVFALRRIDMTLHRVTHHPARVHGVPAYDPAQAYTCQLDMQAIAAVAAAVFIPYGIEIAARPWQSWEARITEDLRQSVREIYGEEAAASLGATRDYPEWVLGSQRGQIRGSTEIARALGTNHVSHTINVYFAGEILASAQDGGAFQNWGGQGVDAHTARRIRSRVGVLMAEDWGPQGGRPPVSELGRALAHEIGHFLTLKHVGNRQVTDPDGADSSWHSLLNLMHPISPTIDAAHWSWPDQHEYRTRPRANDRGYGDRVCGQHLTQKAVPNVPNDDQVHIVRRYLRSPHGPF
ncbi:MAG: hypothetical protein IT373_08310 [Polyangiaceae bacterium]|nr:hypothetical protein [Polyangiaceae bacterium]